MIRLCLTLVALLTAGCTTGFGPKFVRSERPDYNEHIIRSSDTEMLLNLIRLRYNDSPLFLELGTVVASYTHDAEFTAGASISDDAAGTLGGSLALGEHPTVTYTPLTGEEFATRMLTPIPIDAIMLFEKGGWRADRLLLVTVQQFNDILNAPTASGPTPEHPPDYEAFADFAAEMERLRSAELMGFSWEKNEQDAKSRVGTSHFWLRESTSDPAHQEDLDAVRRALGLGHERHDFDLTPYPHARTETQVGIRCRSVLGIMEFLSKAVEVPPPHSEAGLVTVTRDSNGEPFDWSRVTGRIMRIHSQEDEPDNAYVSIRHRGWWFYIRDDDQSSKATFNLLNLLYSLQSANGKGKSPFLTLQIGE